MNPPNSEQSDSPETPDVWSVVRAEPLTDSHNEGDILDRASVSELDAILGKPFRVLDDGFVRAIDYMGSDGSVVQAARVSYGKGTKRVREDRGLIRYLLRNAHTTPFEMCVLKLHVRVPMDVWRQWIRHRTASVNEYSTRYSIAIDAAQRTATDHWRKQSSANRQGSSGSIESQIGADLSAQERQLQELARKVYDDRLAVGVAREQARKDLPLSTYTEAYWKIDLHNLMHFLQLRMDEHAQFEIREYASTIGNEIVARWCPIVWEAFREYRLGALTFTETETAVVAHLIAGRSQAAFAESERHGMVSRSGQRTKLTREASEFEVKLERLGLVAPWD
jgi:thymidylate synthase (FAD)